MPLHRRHTIQGVLVQGTQPRLRQLSPVPTRVCLPSPIFLWSPMVAARSCELRLGSFPFLVATLSRSLIWEWATLLPICLLCQQFWYDDAPTQALATSAVVKTAGDSQPVHRGYAAGQSDQLATYPMAVEYTRGGLLAPTGVWCYCFPTSYLRVEWEYAESTQYS